MKGGKRPPGYTIIEVMIVLAISGVMFLIAATFINGKQDKAAFTSGVNQMSSNFQDIIEQVTDGHYSDVPINCTFNVAGGTSTTSGGNPQGTNYECVFLGKILNYYTQTNYEVATVVGGRVNAGVAIVSLSKSEPTIVQNPNLTSKVVPDKRLKVTQITIDGNPSNKTLAIGFLQSQGSISGDNASVLNNGGQDIGLYYLDNYNGTPIRKDVSATLTNQFLKNNLLPAKSADVCIINDNDSTQRADISLGTNSSNKLSANVIRGTTTACP